MAHGELVVSSRNGKVARETVDATLDGVVLRKLVSRVAYYILCTLMSPLILIGYIVWVGKTIATGPSGVSGTAQGPLTSRFS